MKLKVGLRGVGACALVKVPLVAANNALFIRLMLSLGAHGVENTLTKCAAYSEREILSRTERHYGGGKQAVLAIKLQLRQDATWQNRIYLVSLVVSSNDCCA
jgi:hypothetical protein